MSSRTHISPFDPDPGLFAVEDFLSEEQEHAILAEFESSSTALDHLAEPGIDCEPPVSEKDLPGRPNTLAP